MRPAGQPPSRPLTSMIDPVCPPPIIPRSNPLRGVDHYRRSLPARSAIAPTRRSANYVKVKPASPEVISSLISALSAISQPLEHQSGYMVSSLCSHSTSLSPFPYQAEFPLSTKSGGYAYTSDTLSPTKTGIGMDHEICAKKYTLKENNYLHPDRAADVGASRPSPTIVLSNKTPQSQRSRSYVEGDNDLDETYSMGSLRIDSGTRLSATSTVSSGSGGRKSIRSSRSLDFMGSNERLFEESSCSSIQDVIIDTIPDKEIGDRVVEARKPNLLSTSLMTPEKAVNEGSPRNRSPMYLPAASPRIGSIKESGGGSNELNCGSPSLVGSPRRIPTRDSSLRHSFGSHRRRKSYRSDLSEHQENDKFSFDFSQDSPTQSPTKIVGEIAEDDVTRRIRELKDQKKLRDYRLTIATTELALDLASVGPSCTPSPFTIPKTQVEVSSDSQWPLTAEVGKAIEAEMTESSAPSPAIMQRINRDTGSRVSSIPSRSTTFKHSPLARHHSEVSQGFAASLKRSNSRLLRRLSRPTSPTSAEKPKRSFTSPLLTSAEKPKRSFTSPLADERPKSTDPIDEAVDEYISSPRLSRKIRHPQTGRTISFSEVGDPNGSAVFCCVGMGLTRYITAFYDELALTLKLRLITPDRPGVGASEAHADGSQTPLSWPDDILTICQHLQLTKFSILAHSAGAIYALATALRMPQHIRGRIHLLAPWIPPSQMAAIGTQQEALPASALPYSQRFLRSLPTPFLRAANSSFLSTTSASITTRLPKSPYRSKLKSQMLEIGRVTGSGVPSPSSVLADVGQNEASLSKEAVLGGTGTRYPKIDPSSPRTTGKERKSSYDNRLTEAIWNAATTDANPAVDLLVCLERRQPIGFRYGDITKTVVIHHGSKDTRVPVENVKWLGKTMRRCEVRILEGEGHGLMASATVMGGVLVEMAKEWEDWMSVVQGKSDGESSPMR